MKSLIGKIIHVTENPLRFRKQDGSGSEVQNCWFVGYVAGYSKSTFGYDGVTDSFFKELKEEYSLRLTDGYEYVITDDTEALDINKEEYRDFVERTLKQKQEEAEKEGRRYNSKE